MSPYPSDSAAATGTSAEAQDFYAILGVEASASDDVLRAAYRTLARQLHPDLHDTAERLVVAERFRQVSEAYHVLCDATRRTAYDAAGQIRRSANRGSAGIPEGSPGTLTRTRADDTRVEIVLPFTLAITGGQTVVRVPGLEVCNTCHASGAEPGSERLTCKDCRGAGVVRSGGANSTSATCAGCRGEGALIGVACHTCLGEGVVRGLRRVPFDVPAGLEDAAQIRLVGQGDASLAGGLPGDVLVTVRVTGHPLFRREGANLLIDVPVNVGEAALGAPICVPTPSGAVQVRLPTGVQTGTQLRMRGRGIAGRDGTGDLIAVITVVMPTGELGKKSRKAFETLAEELGSGDSTVRAVLLAEAEAVRVEEARLTEQAQ